MCYASYASWIGILIQYAYAAVSLSDLCDSYLYDSMRNFSALLHFTFSPLSNILALIHFVLLDMILLLKSNMFAPILSTQICSLWSDLIQ